ncbi:MAG: hypothetical protein K2L61_04045, partial [Clostridia bacterium]|nr:hypothetical protein [Clostridia bacterium]
NIVIKNQTAQYGQSDQAWLGRLEDPLSPNAIWSYAQDSKSFYSDHYRNFKFALMNVQPNADLSLLPVIDGGYSIYITDDLDIGDGSIRGNYKVNIDRSVEGKEGIFVVTKAKIRFTGRQYNVAYDLGENNVITKQMLIDRISTGLEEKGVDAGKFTVKMTDRMSRGDTLTSIVGDGVSQTTKIENESDCGMYYVWLSVDGNDNFEPFFDKVELNVLSKWVSVTIGSDGIVGPEYGDEIYLSNQIFDNLIANNQIIGITGFLDANGSMLWDSDKDAAIALLQSYVEIIVGSGDLNTALDKEHAVVGSYSIFMNTIKTGEYENFRFIARTGETDTSNIDAYHIRQRTVTVVWKETMNEVYGEHGGSHTGYEISGVNGRDGVIGDDVVNFILTHAVDKTVTDNNARFEGGHAFAAGYYIAQVTGVTNPNYRIDPNDSNLSVQFQISPKAIEISLHNKDFVYGVDNARIDHIDSALNVYSQTPNYDVLTTKSTFVGNDRRDKIFEIYFDGKIADGLNYIPVGTYTINARQLTTPEAANYKITVKGTGTLTIKPAAAGLNVKQLTTMYFDASDQVVTIDRNWLVLSGDSDIIRNNANVSYKFVSRDTDRDTTTTEYTPEGKYTVRDAGRYVISIMIEAANHETYITDVNLNVTSANVIIKMGQAEKTYGDTLGDMIRKAHEEEGIDGIATLSDWLKIKCGITITMYRYSEGGDRREWPITENALKDFVFYVVDPNNVSGDGGAELQPGSYRNNVGDYRVYHKMASDALAANYSIEYYQEPGSSSKCNAHAYKITPRPVNVSWDVTDKADWNSNHSIYYYTGNTPQLVATFYALADESGTQPSVPLQITGMENVNVNADGAHYTAQVVHSVWESNQHALNYTLTRDTYEYTIVKRALTVTIFNQTKGVYGTVAGDVGVSSEEYSVYDEVLESNDIEYLRDVSIKLVLESVGSYKWLPAGKYAINAICSNDNYDVTFRGREGGECGWLIVEQATFTYAATTDYNGAKYLGADFTLNFKDILSVDGGAFVDGDDWETAWANATITYKQGGVTVDRPIFTGAGLESVQYTLTFANYKDFTGTLNVYVQKAVVNVSISEVSSVYGEDLLDSNQIFAGEHVTLAAGSDDIVIDIIDIISLSVDLVGKQLSDAGKYN